MPNIKSAKKRVKVNAVKAANNKARNTALKTAIKKQMPLLMPTLRTRPRLCSLPARRSTRPLPRTCCTRTPQPAKRAIWSAN